MKQKQSELFDKTFFYVHYVHVNPSWNAVGKRTWNYDKRRLRTEKQRIEFSWFWFIISNNQSWWTSSIINHFPGWWSNKCPPHALKIPFDAQLFLQQILSSISKDHGTVCPFCAVVGASQSESYSRAWRTDNHGRNAPLHPSRFVSSGMVRNTRLLEFDAELSHLIKVPNSCTVYRV